MSRVRQAIYCLGLLLWTVSIQAEESEQEQPSMELLEFLGGAEKIDGEWVDPLNMIELQEDEQRTEQQENHENE